MYVLMRRAAAGLDPLPDRYDFLATINNKAVEYMSAGLPVISSPRKGVLSDLLAAENCGASYDTGQVDALVSLLTALEADPARLASMSRSALVVYERRFRAEAVYGNLIDHLGKIVEQYNQ